MPDSDAGLARQPPAGPQGTAILSRANGCSSRLIAEVLLSEPRQCPSILRPGALQFLGIDPEDVEDSGGDLASLDIIVDGCRNDRGVRNKQGHVAVVLGEAAVLGEFAATRVDQAGCRDGDKVGGAVVAEGVAVERCQR